MELICHHLSTFSSYLIFRHSSMVIQIDYFYAYKKSSKEKDNNDDNLFYCNNQMSDPYPPPQPNPGDPVPQPDPNNPEPMPVENRKI